MKTILILLAFVFISILAGRTFGQSHASDGKSVVYVYSYAAMTTIGQVRKPVFLDDKEIADIRPERYFIARIDPGKHSFHLKNKKLGGVEREFEAGKTYYIRLDWRSGAMLSPAGFVGVPSENGEYDIKQLRPVDKKNIKDGSIALTSL